MKIYLMGYMGCGKSSIGELLSRKLSQKTGYPRFGFIDFDKKIESETGKTISEIFDQNGEDAFRMMEHKLLERVLNKENVVIALGGGTPCYHNNMTLINKSGTSIYLETEAEFLAKRLSHEKQKRPLIRKSDEIGLKSFIEENFRMRVPVYKQAHFTLNISKLRISEAVEGIMKMITN